MATGRELGGSKKHNVSILQEPWKYRLIPCLGIKLFLLMMPSRVFQAFYCAAVSPRRMSVLVASVPSLLPLLYKHWVAIWACDYNLSSSCFLLPKGKASHAVRFWRGAASSTEPLQWPPCPVLFTSNVFRAKISACVWGKTFKCEVVNSSETPGSACCEVVSVRLYGSSSVKDAGQLCWLVYFNLLEEAVEILLVGRGGDVN